MDSHFASPERAPLDRIAADVHQLLHNPVVDCVLESAAGLVAVVNEHRQILAINRCFLDALGLDSPDAVLGLRPGEALDCIHATETPGGCGTSRYCATCGAAIAIVAAQTAGGPDERRCVATVRRDGRSTDICLRALAHPIELDGHKLVVLFLQDISAPEKRAALERIFLHDIANVVTALRGNTDILVQSVGIERDILAERVHALSSRLSDEITLQRVIVGSDDADYHPTIRRVALTDMIEELRGMFTHHPHSEGKRLVSPHPIPSLLIDTDRSALRRVLTNMLANAFEATDQGGEVRLWTEVTPDEVAFCVWNARPIPDPVMLRVFQRHSSTKAGVGRGFGTFAMKLLAERVLNGSVCFTTSAEEGTTFRLTVPVGAG